MQSLVTTAEFASKVTRSLITCLPERDKGTPIGKNLTANQEIAAFYHSADQGLYCVLRLLVLNVSVILFRTKRTKMKNSCNKGLLIPWLLKALNEQLYEGLKWSDQRKKIFYIIWTHKSAEHWSNDVLEPFKAWAAHKGKLAGKNEKQLKATFRCALNSKKDELREVHRNRSQRFWQFIDPKSGEGKSGNKKKRRINNTPSDVVSVGDSNDSSANSFMDCSSSTVNSCCEDFFKPSEEKNSKKKKRKVNRKLVDPNTRSASPVSVGNSFANYMPTPASSETEIARTEKLPSFESIYSFQPLTPPYQENEILLNTPEHSTDYSTLLTEASRLTPPVEIPPKSVQTKSGYINQLNKDIWNPNCWSIPHQELNNFSQFFPNDFGDFGKTPSQNFNSNKTTTLEMDQFVPVMNFDDNTFNYSNRPLYEGNHCEQVNLEDDCIFSSEINSETERVLEELHRLEVNSSAEIGQYTYSS